MEGYLKMFKLNIYEKTIRTLLKPLWCIFVRPFASETLNTKFLYWVVMGHSLDLENPKDFNEKIQWLKLNWKDPLISQCADKYDVREYVKACGCEDILNDLYGVYDKTEDINWESLPDKFVLKCTHGCGYNIICTDKSKLDKKASLAKLKKWMQSKYGLRYVEYHYLAIKPRIICEQYIETEDGSLPNDYKISCFKGKAFYVAVCTGRPSSIKWHFFDMKWNLLDIVLPTHNIGELPAKPLCWDRMVEVATALSEVFPFVRIDLYDDRGRVVFGEMTFTPGAGLFSTFYSQIGLNYLGGLLNLPEIKKR